MSAVSSCIASAYTVLGSCHMNGVDPLAYMTDVITKLQDGWPKSRLNELLPDRWRFESEGDSLGVSGVAAE